MQQKSIRAVRASSNDERGFTLLEVIIAMFILVVALLSLISLTVMIIKGNSLSREMTTATTLARDKMENLKNKAFTNSELTGGLTAVTHNDAGNPLEVIFTRRWTVVDNATPATLKTVTVTVSWNWGILPRSVALSIIIAQ